MDVNNIKMKFHKKDIESSITYDEDNFLYCVNLAGINRSFQGIFYSYENVQKSYLNNLEVNNIETGIYLPDMLIGISKIYDYYIICLIGLEDLQSRYYFVQNYEIFNFEIKSEKYYGFVYRDIHGNIGYQSNYDTQKEKGFEIYCDDKKFSIKNKIFQTEIYQKNILFLSQSNKKENKIEKNNKMSFIDIIDIYVYNDFFINNVESNFKDFIEKINLELGGDISIEIYEYNKQYYPAYKINIQISKELLKDIETGNYGSLENISKILFSFHTESMVGYFIDNQYINTYFSKNIIDVTRVKIEDIDTNFNLPEDIFSTNEKYIILKKKLLILRYNYFLLHQNLEYINNLESNNIANDNIQIANIRLNMNKKTLEIMSKKYQEKLEYFLKKLGEKIKSLCK